MGQTIERNHKDKNTKHVMMLKLQPAIFLLSKHVIRFYELPAEAMQCILQWAPIVYWSLSGIMTSDLVISESAASSILISRMTYIKNVETNVHNTYGPIVIKLENILKNFSIRFS